MFEKYYNEYFEKDLIVIPLRGKIPVLKNWSLFAKTRPSELLLDSWENKYKRFNIGLICGELSGVIAIDIDKEEALKKVPLSPVTKKGKKGETRFFRYNGEVNFKRHDLGIELLSNGNQTVLPPSIHPETKEAYVWNGQFDLLSFDIEDLPILDPDWLREIGMIPVDKQVSSGRHNRLIEICSAMFARGEDPTAIANELIRYDEENHSPAYFTDDSEAHGGKGFNSALKMIASVSETITRRGGDVSPKKFEIVFGEKEVEKAIEENEKKEQMKEVIYPEPPGMIKEIQDHILSISHKPRDKFALAGALGLIGTLLSNKVKFHESTPNLYQLLIAESGEGKDVPLKAPKELLIEAGLLQYVGLESYRGDKSVVKKFESQRERVDTLDEVSKLFRSINSKSNTFQSNIAETLTEIWNSSSKLFMGHTTAEGTTGMVFKPCLSIMGATTPNSFSETFSSSNLMQGFGGRFVYIFDDRRVKLKRVRRKKSPENVLDFIEYWGTRNVEIENVDISKTATFHLDLSQKNPQTVQLKDLECPEPIDLPIQEEAEKLLDKASQYFDEYRYHCEEMIIPIVLRAYQQIEKIMIISAIATAWEEKGVINPAPMIKASDVQFAWEYVEATIKSTAIFFGRNLIQSSFQRDAQKVLKVLRGFPKGLSKKDLTYKLRNSFKANQLYNKRDGIITSLCEDGRLKEFKVKPDEGKGGTGTTLFVLNKDLDN